MSDPPNAVDRAERRQVLLVGVPLALLLALPWSVERAELAWSLPFPLAAPLVALGVCGVLFVLAALAVPHHRRLATVLTGGAALATSWWLLEAVVDGPKVEIPAIRHLSFPAVRIWSLLLAFAAGSEMAMHRRPRSRALSMAALVGWLAVLAAFLLLPLGGALEARMTPAAAVATLLGDDPTGGRYDHLLPLYGAVGYFSLVALVGALQCARRVGLERRSAAVRRFHTPWLAWALFPAPMLVGAIGLLVLAAFEQPASATKVIYLFAATFGPLLGATLAWRTLLVGELIELTPRRVLVGVDVVLLSTILGIGLWNGFHPDARDGAVGELSADLGRAVEAALRGEPIDERFLGDYGDFDLRAARDIELPRDARIELVALRVSADLDGSRRTAYALTLPDGRVRWVARDGAPVHWELDEWRHTLSQGALRGYGAAIHRLQDAGCLLFVDDSVVKAPGVRAELGGFDPVCHGSARLRTLSSQHGRENGVIDRYLVSFVTDEGERLSVGGHVHPHGQGRVWLGPPHQLATPEDEEDAGP